MYENFSVYHILSRKLSFSFSQTKLIPTKCIPSIISLMIHKHVRLYVITDYGFCCEHFAILYFSCKHKIDNFFTVTSTP